MATQPTEIPEAGYSDLRAHIESAWTQITLLKGTAEALVIPKGDSRVKPTSSGDLVTFTTLLKGDDTDIKPKLPLAVDGLALHAGSGPPVSTAAFPEFTFKTDTDSLHLVHEVQIPVPGPEVGPEGPPGRSVQVFAQDPGAKAAPGDFWIIP